MEIKRISSQPSVGPIGSRGPYTSIRFFSHLIRHLFKAPA